MHNCINFYHAFPRHMSTIPTWFFVFYQILLLWLILYKNNFQYLVSLARHLRVNKSKILHSIFTLMPANQEWHLNFWPKSKQSMGALQHFVICEEISLMLSNNKNITADVYTTCDKISSRKLIFVVSIPIKR